MKKTTKASAADMKLYEDLDRLINGLSGMALMARNPAHLMKLTEHQLELMDQLAARLGIEI